MSEISMIRKLLVAVVLAFASVQAAFAEDEAAALEKAQTKLKNTLEQVDGLFYKEQTTDSGAKFYVIVWEMDGETSKIYFELRLLGNYRGEPVFGVFATTLVAQSEGSMPPAVIKAVTVKNDSMGLGTYSMPASFDKVFISFAAPSDTMTPGQIWMACAYMHSGRAVMKKIIDELMSASGG